MGIQIPVRLNPLRWKKQHQIASAGFILLGALAGAGIGNYLAFQLTTELQIGTYDPLYADTFMRFMALGAVVTASLTGITIYFLQLLRA